MPPPPALRPYLGFAKQTPRSLAAIARVVEQDAEFRRLVADAADEDQVGRAGWLWLTRPDGWEVELDAIETAAAARSAEAVEAREERAATRKLAAAQAAAARAEADAASRLVELEEARGDLARERAARADAEARVVELEASVADLTADRAAVVRNLKEVEARLVDRATEVNATRARIRALEVEARELRAGAPAAPPAPAHAPPGPAGEADGAVTPGVLQPGAGAADAPARRALADAAPAPPTGRGRVGRLAAVRGGADPAVVADEVARAAGGAAALADALGALARLLGGGDATGPLPGAVATGDAGTGAGDGPPPAAAAPPAGDASAPPLRERRVPLALPGGVFDDSVEAAEHLLRAPGAVLVVDGYNVTMAGWPDLTVADQRRRLVAGVSDLAVRTATTVEVVFDGAEVEPLTTPIATRQLVRVRFSDPGVEADDVVIDLVARLPAATPVVVVSSDNRVRDGVRRLGANLLHARQLLALLRR